MSARSYVRWAASWHVLGKVPLDGWDTLCGHHITPAQNATMSDALPLGQKSCESCARLALVREDRQRAAEAGK